MKNIFLCACAILACAIATQSLHAQKVFTGKPQYQIKTMRSDTVLGNIVVELFPAIAPLAVENFDSLVAIHFFDSTAFHRVKPGFMIQGGDPNSRNGDTSMWGYGDQSQTTVDAEFSALSHRRGILSAARSNDSNSATSQFFICVGNPTYLDHQYSIYGQAIMGMDVVDKIVTAPTYSTTNRPLDKISMYVTYLGSNDSVPAAPTLVSPTSGSASPYTLQTLKWQLIPSAMLYDVQVASDAAFSSIIIDTQINQITSTAKVKLPTGFTYYWRVFANNGGHVSPNSTPWSLTIGTAGVASADGGIDVLYQSYPNPSSGISIIPFDLARSESVLIRVSDELGREALCLAEDVPLSPGKHAFEIGAGRLPPGPYTVELRTRDGIKRNHIIIK